MNCCNEYGKCKGGKDCPVGEPLPIDMLDDPADELRRLYFENEKFRASLAEQPAQHKLLPQGEWPKHPSPYVNDQYRGYLRSDLDDCAMQVLAAHGIKENT